MNTGRNDEDLKRLFEEEKRLDAPQTPPFHRILQGRKRRRVRVLSTGRWAVAAVAVILAVAISVPVRERFQSHPNEIHIERPINTSQSLPEREDQISPKEETIMNRSKNKRSSSNSIYAMALSVLFLPTGLFGQDAAGPAVSAEKPMDLSYLKDNLSDFLLSRLEEEYKDSVNGSIADVAHSQRRYVGTRILQRQLTLSQTLETFLSFDNTGMGTQLFHGRYGQRNGNGYAGAPSDLWLMQAPDGSLSAVYRVTAKNYSLIARGNSLNQMTGYWIGAAEMDGLPAYQIQYEFGSGSTQKTSRTKKGSSKVTQLSYPGDAICYNSFTAANIALRGLALQEGEVRELSAIDVDGLSQNLNVYSVRFEHKGKEAVTVPAGTFNANRIEATVTNNGNSPSPERSGQVIDFWILDNGIIVRVLHLRENVDVFLTEYMTPTPLEGTLEDPSMKAVPLESNNLVTLDIPANSWEYEAWLSTGYSVKAGDRIAFRATGMTRYTNADGYPPVDADGEEVDQNSANLPFIAPHSPVSALVGKIVTTDKPSEIFTIGKESVYEVKQAGVLFLGLNDQYGASWNNSGILKTEFIIGNLPPAASEVQRNTQAQAIQEMGKVKRAFGVFKPFTSTAMNGPVQPIGSISGRELNQVSGVTVSPDGQHLYAATTDGSVLCLDRNSGTGHLQITQTIQDPRFLKGMMVARISPDNRYLATVSCATDSVVLFARDPDSGVLFAVDMVGNWNLEDRTLDNVTHSTFSPDSKFLYVLGSESAAVTAFKITEAGKLEKVDATRGEAGCFGDARGIDISPDGKTIYVASARGNSLVVLNRDLVSGKMKIRQIIRDGEIGVTGLSGAFGVSCSLDGKYVYACSGRFGGDSAVMAFKVQADGTLAFLQEFLGGPGGTINFLGGNDIWVSPDGKRVVATGANSNTLVCFTVNPATGMLNLVQTLTRDEKNPDLLNVPDGTAFSPDGRFLYVTMDDKSITVFRWND
jgi:DNA-binding beta-propeller fold protein YncE